MLLQVDLRTLLEPRWSLSQFTFVIYNQSPNSLLIWGTTSDPKSNIPSFQSMMKKKKKYNTIPVSHLSWSPCCSLLLIQVSVRVKWQGCRSRDWVTVLCWSLKICLQKGARNSNKSLQTNYREKIMATILGDVQYDPPHTHTPKNPPKSTREMILRCTLVVTAAIVSCVTLQDHWQPLCRPASQRQTKKK